MHKVFPHLALAFVVLLPLALRSREPTPLALIWRHETPTALDPETLAATTPDARQLVSREAYLSMALLREFTDLRATVMLSPLLLAAIDGSYLTPLLPLVDREGRSIDISRRPAFARVDPWIRAALWPDETAAALSLELVERERRQSAVLDRFPQYSALLARDPTKHKSADRLELACWHLLASLHPAFLREPFQLASGSAILLQDLVDVDGHGRVWKKVRFDRRIARRLVVVTLEVLEGFFYAHRALQFDPSFSRGNIEVAALSLSSGRPADFGPTTKERASLVARVLRGRVAVGRYFGRGSGAVAGVAVHGGALDTQGALHIGALAGALGTSGWLLLEGLSTGPGETSAAGRP